MTLENQVCTPQQAKRLQQLGVEHGDDLCEFYHYLMIENEDYVYKVGHKNDPAFGNGMESLEAFTVAELGVMLIIDDDTHFVDCRYNEHLGCWQSELTKRSEKEDEDTEFNIVHKSSQEADTEAEVRAAMLIHLLETNLITAETCNKRLSQ